MGYYPLLSNANSYVQSIFISTIAHPFVLSSSSALSSGRGMVTPLMTLRLGMTFGKPDAAQQLRL
jgi:hypothetical protein